MDQNDDDCGRYAHSRRKSNMLYFTELVKERHSCEQQYFEARFISEEIGKYKDSFTSLC